MKKKIILTTIISLFLAAVCFAQTAKPDYAGEWELDTIKSKLPTMMQVDSMRLKVSSTEKELTVESVSRRASGAANRASGRTQVDVYEVKAGGAATDGGADGKETRRVTITADGKLNLTTTLNLKNETGGAAAKINEVWELLDDGATLKITRYMETPRGATNAEMYFTRKSVEGIQTRVGIYEGTTSSEPVSEGNTAAKGGISGGVLNGKAVRLTRPEYPAAAKAVKASGAVSVQVTIDEQGVVIAARAVSGHPLLRAAAEQAARAAEFTPTLLEGVPVKVTGVIVYNFVP